MLVIFIMEIQNHFGEVILEDSLKQIFKKYFC